MQLTIERLRTVVLATGVLLLAALGVFLGVARFKSHFNVRELPKRLGVNIQQEANGVTFSHSLGAHLSYKIHASKEVQLKQGTLQLHDVKIELYGEDGSRVDRISGDEFEYDPKIGRATADGPVEIMLMRPSAAPAIAPRANPDKAINSKTLSKPLANAAEAAAAGEVHVKTSGLTFDYNTGVTTTSQHVDFSMAQGAGSSMGATYDSQQGILVLDHDVELTTRRSGATVGIHARHAVFERDNLACSLTGAAADYRGGKAAGNEATVLFREDGSAVRMDVTNGFTLATANGGHLEAPRGTMDFDEHNQPRHGYLEGGVRMDSLNGGRQVHATSPTMRLEFTKQGELSLAHLERGVEFRSEETSLAANGKKDAVPMRVSRTWRSPVADVSFRSAERGRGAIGHGKVEPAAIHGIGGVVIAGETQRGSGAPVPSKMAADEFTGAFGPNSELTAMTGTGHATIEEMTATGAKETASGDRLTAKFASKAPAEAGGAGASGPGGAQIQSAVLDGHVVLVEQPAAKAGAQAQPPMLATAGHAVYEGAGGWLHLTMSPRVADGAMQLAAEKIDVSQESGDAFAHGDVKATWLDSGKTADARAGGEQKQAAMSLGGEGPAHAIAEEAQLHRSTSEATFKGHARLWQEANSIEAPVIVIDRPRKTLVARTTDRAEPVRVVLLSAGGLDMAAAAGKKPKANAAAPTVVRMRGGELDYSDVDRKAVMVGGAMGTVVAETGDATSISNRVELYLTPAGKSTTKEAVREAGRGAGQGQVERLRASGHVSVSSAGRRGTGEQLTYESRTGEYVLTGTAATPPRIVDPARGNVTGEALIFSSGDDSVRVEGGGHETRTETTVRQGVGRSEPQK